MSSKYKNKAVKNLSPVNCKTYQNSSVKFNSMAQLRSIGFRNKTFYYKDALLQETNESLP